MPEVVFQKNYEHLLRAVARPIPDAPPVTNATLPVSVPGMVRVSFVWGSISIVSGSTLVERRTPSLMQSETLMAPLPSVIPLRKTVMHVLRATSTPP
jgi:hypothetical protein